MHNQGSPALRVVELDALRGIAALAVVAFHYTTQYGAEVGHLTPLSWGFPAGNYGVHLFFLISGFVIFMTLERTRTAMDFVVSRFSRLFPGYWAAMAITALVVYGIGMSWQRISAHDLLFNLTMFQQVLGGEHLDGSYWTLQVELFFYAQMLFWFVLGQLRRIHWVIAGWLALSVFYGESIQHHMHFSYLAQELLILRHIPFFAMGILFYRLYSNPAEARLNIGMIGLCLLAIWIELAPVFLLVALVCCAIFALFVSDRLRWMRGKFFAWLGAISYSLYLLHQAVGFALIHWLETHGVHSALAVWLAFLPVLALASLLAYGWERSAMRWIRAQWKRRPTRMETA